MVYGFASAFLLTGEDAFLEAAERGTLYLRDHMRFSDPDEGVTYWYHGIQVTGNREQKLAAYREVCDQLLLRIRKRFAKAGAASG